MPENLKFNFQILLDSIGLIQGVTLGILLMVMGLRNYRQTFYLGLFLLFYSLELGYWIAINSRISSVHPEFFLLPLNFSWILFPLFYLYTQQVSVFSNTKVKYWLLIPGMVSILVQIVIYTLPNETRMVIKESFWYELVFWVLGNYFSWGVGLWNLRLLYRHRIEVLNTYSYISFKELRWARFFLIYLLATSVFSHLIAYVFPYAFKDNTIFSVMDLIAIYWVSYYGITQRNVRSLFLQDLKSDPDRELSDVNKKTTEIIPERLEDLMDKIDDYMKSTRVYTNPELTIVDLAEGISKHPKLVSEAINTVGKQNFNSYVNHYRIKMAEALLVKGDSLNLSVEGIGIEAGFKSKSTFYSAFKKFTGTTPSRFKDDRAA
jgi:AraC-like DNA-binding protein